MNGARYRTLAGDRGLVWLRAGIALLRREPARLLLMGMLMQLLLTLSQAPSLGLLVVLCVPALTAGLLQALRVTRFGGRPAVLTLFAAFGGSGRLWRLLMLGGLMLAGGMLAVSMILAGQVQTLDPDLVRRIEAGDVSALQQIDPAVIRRLALALIAGMALTGIVGYFAIPLVWFRDAPLGAAIMLGLKALFANWRPFLSLGVLLAVLTIPVGLLAAMLFGLAGAGGGFGAVFVVLAMIVVLAYQLVLFATQFVAFEDVFGDEGADPDGEAGDRREPVDDEAAGNGDQWVA